MAKMAFMNKSFARSALGLLLALPMLAAQGAAGAKYPRLMGMNIGEKNYHEPLYQSQLARLDIVILGFYRGWGEGWPGQSMRDAVRSLKRLNPDLLVGQYTLLNEASGDRANSAENDKQAKLDQENWWLKRADGRRVQWTGQYDAWDINITAWSGADAQGNRYPEWLAQRDYRAYFSRVPEFDIWYFDNVMVRQRISSADWRRSGKDESGSDPKVQEAFRLGQAAHWKKARELAPNLLFMGNPDNDLSLPEYKGRLQGAFLEGLMGTNWSLESNGGWERAMERYHKVSENLLAPRIVGFNVWGDPQDYRFLRYALASCLLGDGYFSFTDKAKGYSSVPWFDEYDVKLGKPLEGPQTRAWKDGAYRRLFENGMVVVNPTSRPVRLELGQDYARFRGRQAPEVNNGAPAGTLVLAPRDGMLLVKK